jgi:ribose transport system substrate-binding protein
MARTQSAATRSRLMPGRRNFLLSTGVLGAGSVLAACTNTEDEPEAAASQEQEQQQQPAEGSMAPGDTVTVAVSVPAADHGWLAAVTSFAQQAGDSFEDVELELVEGGAASAEQIGNLETLISSEPDALVILPHEGQALTEISIRAMDAGIPVINLDRIFDSPLAYRNWIGGDNYGMGVSAAHYIGQELPDGGSIAEIQGIASLELTQQRSQGFADTLAAHYPNIEVVAQQSADFTPDSGQEVMSNVLQAQPQLDAVWNHDDDQGVGVEAAVNEAGRDEFFMVGGAGSTHVMESIQNDGIWKATVLYSPSMAGTAIYLARLVAQNRGMDGFLQPEIPQSITLYAALVTADNVDQYLEVGF